MSELVERYVHQVGRYLPPRERAEIEAELRSQIQDQLDDRYPEPPTQADVAAVLAEFGHPYRIAASYTSDRYLIGPEYYPYTMLVLRYVWLLVPAVVIFLDLFGALAAPEPRPLLDVIGETLVSVIQAVLGFSALVVLFFALMQRWQPKMDAQEESFNPLDLPEADDPSVVDRFEAVAGIAIGTVATLVFLYFLSVGGLTLRFNLSDPGEVVPVPLAWLALLTVTIISQVLMHVLVLRRKRWNVALYAIETVLEVFGMVCLYFAILVPAFDRLVMDQPHLSFLGILPEIIAVGGALTTLFNRGGVLVRLWGYRNAPAQSFNVQPE